MSFVPPTNEDLAEIGAAAYRHMVSADEEKAMLKLPKTYFTWARSVTVGDITLPLPAPRPFPASVEPLSDDVATELLDRVAEHRAREAEHNEKVASVVECLDKYSTIVSLAGHEPRLLPYLVAEIGMDKLKEAGVCQAVLDEYLDV